METRGRIANANKARLPEAVVKNDDLWCMDLLNLPASPSFEGNIHCLILIDAWSSCRTVPIAQTKSGLIPQLARYLLWHYNYTERHSNFFQIDGAGELKVEEINAVMEKYGISPRYSESYDARANGRAEKSVDMAVKYLRSVLHHSGLPAKFRTYALTYWSHVRNRIPLESSSVDKEDKVGESSFSTYFPNATNVSNFAIFRAFATVHHTKPRMSDLQRHSKLALNTPSGAYLGLTPPGRSRKGVMIYVGVLQKVIIVRQCNLDPTFLPYCKTNRRIKPFEDPGFPESLRMDQPDQRDLLRQLEKDFPDIPPKHDVDGRADAHISVPHANDEDAAALFSNNSPAGSGSVLQRQESLSECDTNASSSDRTSAPIRHGFTVCKSLVLSDLDDRGLRAFFETCRMPLLLPRNWYPQTRTSTQSGATASPRRRRTQRTSESQRSSLWARQPRTSTTGRWAQTLATSASSRSTEKRVSAKR